MNSETKNCQNCKKDFTIEPEDFSFYEKMKVPAPTWCPECRLVRRFVWRNEGNFYKNKCSLCHKDIITTNSSNNKFPIYCHECWWSDKWDATNFGQDYDFAKPFFTQYKELIQKTPNLNLWGFENINSDYANYSAYSKNIYLALAIKCENVFYSRALEKSKDCVDCYWVLDSELCYENFNTTKSFKSIFLNNCKECIGSAFLFDCANCQNCFMCVNLRNKSFYIRNKKYSKEDYYNELEKYNLSSYASLKEYKEEFNNLVENSIHKFAQITNCINVSGDNITNSKNAHQCFMVEGENIKYCWRETGNIKDSYDITGGLYNELIYECSLAADDNYFVKFFANSKGNKNSDFIYLCINSSNLFGCFGLRNKSYCILNKQYTKEEYEILVPKIMAHMNDMPYLDSKGRIYKYGEFFPIELSPFAYNETIAQEYFPLAKEEALSRGYKWKDKEEKNYTIDIRNGDIPDNGKDVKEDIVGKAIECEHKGECSEQCTRAFKIIPEELQFYKRMNLPLPHLCPNCRHLQRLKQRNPLKLWHRKCMKPGCNNEFETPYSPERKEIIYCETCYNKEVA